MKIGYKLYFMSEKLKKCNLFIQFFFSYNPILDFVTKRSVFYLCKILLLCGTSWANRQAYPRLLVFFLAQKSVGSLRSRMLAWQARERLRDNQTNVCVAPNCWFRSFCEVFCVLLLSSFISFYSYPFKFRKYATYSFGRRSSPSSISLR